MADNILDDELIKGRIEEISNRIIGEMKLSEQKYPKKVIECVNQEIEIRNLKVEDYMASEKVVITKTNLVVWVKKNPKISILVFFMVVIAGLKVGLAILLSIYLTISLKPT